MPLSEEDQSLISKYKVSLDPARMAQTIVSLLRQLETLHAEIDNLRATQRVLLHNEEFDDE